jgi:hypothetical protein
MDKPFTRTIAGCPKCWDILVRGACRDHDRNSSHCGLVDD